MTAVTIKSIGGVVAAGGGAAVRPLPAARLAYLRTPSRACSLVGVAFRGLSTSPAEEVAQLTPATDPAQVAEVFQRARSRAF